MADLSRIEKIKLERLFGMASGYVLDLSNRTFAETVLESTGEDIYDVRYLRGSGSKAQRLRAFWDSEPNTVVGKLLLDLLEYQRELGGPAPESDLHREVIAIAQRLLRRSATEAPSLPVPSSQASSATDTAARPRDRPPSAFISYSHDSPQHKAWVATLADRLRQAGVDVVLDQWDLGLGDDVAKFMERGVSGVDRVLVVCTPTYVRKANDGTGGVGYEAMVVTGELVRDLGTSKFIPILREKGDPPLPRVLGTRLYVDLSGTWVECADAFTTLLRTLHGKPARHKPPLGRSPFDEQDNPEATQAPSTAAVLVRLTVHVARFRSGPQLYYFVNLANVTDRPVEVTHVWYKDSANHVRVSPPSRPLPVRLQPSQAWSTWLAVDAVPQPHRTSAHNMFRIRLSDGTVLMSARDDTIPPEGIVPGGAIDRDRA